MIVEGWLGEMDHLFSITLPIRLVMVILLNLPWSFCLGFLGNGYGEADLHIIQELPTGKYPTDDVGQDGNDDGRCMLEMFAGDTEDVCRFVVCQGPNVLQNLVSLDHRGGSPEERTCEEQPLGVH